MMFKNEHSWKKVGQLSPLIVGDAELIEGSTSMNSALFKDNLFLQVNYCMQAEAKHLRRTFVKTFRCMTRGHNCHFLS